MGRGNRWDHGWIGHLLRALPTGPKNPNGIASRPMPDRFVNLTDGAARLGISPKTLRKWQYQGRVPYYKVGRRVQFRVSDLDGLRVRREGRG